MDVFSTELGILVRFVKILDLRVGVEPPKPPFVTPLHPAARYSTRSDDYQLEQTLEIFLTHLRMQLHIQSSQQSPCH
jgi:hypothetical protein